jgi:hypothetical protein
LRNQERYGIIQNHIYCGGEANGRKYKKLFKLLIDRVMKKGMAEARGSIAPSRKWAKTALSFPVKCW